MPFESTISSQPLVRPPTFVFTSSEPADIGGTSIWVKLRGKKKDKE